MSKLHETAINTLVMPQLEYASAVWDPHTKVMTSQIEQVQRKAARLIVSNYDWQVSATKIESTLVKMPYCWNAAAHLVKSLVCQPQNHLK